MNQRSSSNVNPVFAVGVISSAIIAAIASVLYGVAYYNSYDTAIRHFESGALLPVVFGVLLALSFVVFTVTSLLLRRRLTLTEADMTSGEMFSLWFAAVMFVIFGAMSIATGQETVLPSKLGEFCTKVSAPLAMLSGVSLFIAASERFRNTTAHRVASFAPILWGLSLLFKYYFDLSVMPLNDPELTLTMVSISASLVFFLSECRSALGINTPCGAVFASAAALCMTGAVSVARIVLWRTAGHVVPSPMESILLLAVAILAGARLYAMRNSIVPSACDADDGENKTNDEGNEADEEQNV